MCNSSANSLLGIFLITLTEVFLSKHLETTEASPHWYPSHFESLAILNVLSLVNVLLFKYLKSP